MNTKYTNAIVDFSTLDFSQFSTNLEKYEFLVKRAKSMGLSSHGMIRVIRSEIDAFTSASFEAQSGLQFAMWHAICKCALHNVRLCYRALDRNAA